MKQDLPKLTDEVLLALGDLFYFWFGILWSLTLLIALFRSVKYIFNSCENGYSFKLLKCPKKSISDSIEVVGYGDLVRVWRKWFMLLIWLVGSEMVLSLVFTYIFTNLTSLFEWFNIYVLFIFILFGGYLSFILLGARASEIRIVKC